MLNSGSVYFNLHNSIKVYIDMKKDLFSWHISRIYKIQFWESMKNSQLVLCVLLFNFLLERENYSQDDLQNSLLSSSYPHSQ